MGQYARHLFVCTTGSTCPAQADTELYVKRLRAEAALRAPGVEIRINRAGCLGQCGHGPMLVVYPEDVWYAGVTAADLPEIVQAHLVDGAPVERLRYRPGKAGSNVVAKARP